MADPAAAPKPLLATSRLAARSFLGLVALVVLAACGGSDAVVTTPGTGAWRVTGTTVPGVEPTEGVVELSLVGSEGIDAATCPNVELPPQESLAPDVDDAQVGAAQAEIEPDFQRLQAYAAEHRDDLGDAWWQNGVPMRIAVTMDANVEQHCTALRSILQYPDRLEIQIGLSQGTLEAIVTEMQRDWPHSGYVASVDQGRVVAHLWPGEETAAEQMTDRYGYAVELWLGLQRYPDGYIRGRCLGWLNDTIEPFVEVELSSVDVEVGGRFQGSASFTNPGPEDVGLEDVWLQAVVVEPGSTTPLAVATGPTPSTVGKASLQPNESTEASFVGGTASCDPAIGFTLPPGEYEYRVLVVTHRAPAIDDMALVGFWSDASSLLTVE